jgi:hypothetical protein
LNELVDSFKKKSSALTFQQKVSPGHSEKEKEFKFDPSDTTANKEFQNFGRTIFATAESEEFKKNTIKVYPENILFQNIGSYLGGQKDYWKRASENSDVI